MATITINVEEYNRLKSENAKLRSRAEADEEQIHNKNIALERAHSVLYAESRAQHREWAKARGL